MLILFIIFYGTLTLSFLYLFTKNKGKMLFYLPLFWMIEEMLSTYFYEFDSNGTINILTFLYIAYAIYYYKTDILKFSLLLLLFLIIAFINTPFTLDYLSFGNRYLNLFNIYMILPISYFVIKDILDVKILIRNLSIGLSITLIYIFISSFLKVGPNMYNTGLIYGLNWGQYYGPALVAIIFLIFGRYYNITSKQKIISVLFIVVTFLTFRRTAILIILLFSFLSFLFSIDIKKIPYLIVVTFLVTLIYFALDNFSNIKQSDRMIVLSGDYDITREGRYYDIFGVYYLMEKDKSLLTGYELFNEYGNYGAKRDARPIHVDLMRIFYGVGFIGILPLIFMLFNKLFQLNRLTKSMKSFGIGLMSVFFLTLMTGGSLYISYSGIVFIFLGGLLSLANRTRSYRVES